MIISNSQMAQVIQEDRGVKTRRIIKRRKDSTPSPVLFLIWLLLVFTHLPRSTANHHGSVVSSRKAKFFQTALPQFHAAGLVSGEPNFGGAEKGSIYDEDKRIIHTGPNPLHN
ncbi:hypothetical protein L2E82_13624 [Cichorium intybus]|uniref:Uncharacterized protein n=1 Tax=Cichorium intybus TaxID=13427 RepID=A0ACB9EXF7_CICIN|nr:hypothetical protein L2E82_13624 [Cichorium intybus]